MPNRHQWGRQTAFDVPAARRYAQAVYASIDQYVSSLRPEDLGRSMDFFGRRVSLAWILTNVVLTHVAGHCGEVSALKGMQGARGYPV